MQHLTKSTFAEQVIELVKQRIRDGELCSGDKVSEVALATECGISRAPVREALYFLEAEGFIMSHPKRGRCVTILTSQDIRHSYELCGLLEGAAAYSASLAMNDSHWDKLEKVLNCMQQGTGCTMDDEGKADLSTIFHTMLLQHTTNPLLMNVARKFGHVISKYLMFQQWRTLYTSAEMHARHVLIYEAARSCNEVRIKETIRDHFADAGNRLATILEKHD